jgi:hypothetical protein
VIFKPNLERLPDILLGLIEKSGAVPAVSAASAMASTTQSPRAGDFDIST